MIHSLVQSAYLYGCVCSPYVEVILYCSGLIYVMILTEYLMVIVKNNQRCTYTYWNISIVKFVVSCNFAYWFKSLFLAKRPTSCTKFDICLTVHHWQKYYRQPTRCNNNGLLIIPISSTCFGQLFCPSSGALDCVLQLVV